MYRFWGFFLIILLLSCNQKVFSPLTFEGSMLEWGTGGGFTGGVSTWCLLENGHLFKSEDGGKNYTHLGKWEKQKSNQYFNNFTTLGLDKMTLNEPGNKYYFITIKQKQGSHKITWGYQELENKVPAILYKNLMNAVKTVQP